MARILLRAAPGAQRTQIVGRHGDAWKIRIAAAPERGKANDEVRAFLARLAGVRRGDVTIVTGAGSRDKLVDVEGVSQEELEGMLSAASGQ